MKLSGKQQFILDKMKAGATAIEMTGYDHYWFLTDRTSTRCTKQIPALLKAGVIEVFATDWKGSKCRVKQVRP